MKISLRSNFDEISFNRLQNLWNFEGQNFLASALASRVLASASRVLASLTSLVITLSRYEKEELYMAYMREHKLMTGFRCHQLSLMPSHV